MLRKGLVLLVVALLVGITGFAASQVHLTWSTNDVYTTITVNW